MCLLLKLKDIMCLLLVECARITTSFINRKVFISCNARCGGFKHYVDCGQVRIWDSQECIIFSLLASFTYNGTHIN